MSDIPDAVRGNHIVRPKQCWMDENVPLATDECLIWPFRVDGSGYGTLNVEGSYKKATHYALELDGRPRPNRMHALHSCDVRACVNPKHLRWGTNHDNVRDAVRRGRQARPDNRGERCASAKLSEDQVMDIRCRYARGDVLQRELAKEYGVQQNTISRIVNGVRWSHV